MDLDSIKQKLNERNIFFKEDYIFDYPSVVGYEKVFKLKWMATQLNTFVVASNLEDEMVDVSTIESHLAESFTYAKNNYSGWPVGLQSGLGVITFILSSNLTAEAIEYCHKLSSGKKWAGFTIPVLIDTKTQEVHSFDKKPMWGRIYYPHFEKMIEEISGK